MIGVELGLSGNELQDVELGALLHDVGKIGISDTILLKPSKLTEQEWVVMRGHPELGYELLAGIDFLENARKLVREHHECWDGSGYPNRIAGTDICLGARIFAVCDTLDAITSDRPYRRARPFEVAHDEIVAMSGSQFDPEVVRAFTTIGERWLHAIRVGKSQESASLSSHPDAVVAGSLAVLPEIGDAFAWLSAARRRQQMNAV